jgi:hypothetical protein
MAVGGGGGVLPEKIELQRHHGSTNGASEGTGSQRKTPQLVLGQVVDEATSHDCCSSDSVLSGFELQIEGHALVKASRTGLLRYRTKRYRPIFFLDVFRLIGTF